MNLSKVSSWHLDRNAFSSKTLMGNHHFKQSVNFRKCCIYWIRLLSLLMANSVSSTSMSATLFSWRRKSRNSNAWVTACWSVRPSCILGLSCSKESKIQESKKENSLGGLAASDLSNAALFRPRNKSVSERSAWNAGSNPLGPRLRLPAAPFSLVNLVQIKTVGRVSSRPSGSSHLFYRFLHPFGALGFPNAWRGTGAPIQDCHGSIRATKETVGRPQRERAETGGRARQTAKPLSPVMQEPGQAKRRWLGWPKLRHWSSAAVASFIRSGRFSTGKRLRGGSPLRRLWRICC